jgi:hypothetical protein
MYVRASEVKVIKKGHTINPGNKLGHSPHASLDPRLSKDIIILDSIEEAGKTPKGVCFDCVEN